MVERLLKKLCNGVAGFCVGMVAAIIAIPLLVLRFVRHFRFVPDPEFGNLGSYMWPVFLPVFLFAAVFIGVVQLFAGFYLGFSRGWPEVVDYYKNSFFSVQRVPPFPLLWPDAVNSDSELELADEKIIYDNDLLLARIESIGPNKAEKFLSLEELAEYKALMLAAGRKENDSKLKAYQEYLASPCPFSIESVDKLESRFTIDATWPNDRNYTRAYDYNGLVQHIKQCSKEHKPAFEPCTRDRLDDGRVMLGLPRWIVNFVSEVLGMLSISKPRRQLPTVYPVSSLSMFNQESPSDVSESNRDPMRLIV